MTFTSSSTSRPRLHGPKPPKPANDEINRRLTTYESKNESLQMKVDALAQMMQSNPQSSTENAELKAKLALTEAKYQSAEKDLIEKTKELHKAELDLHAKEIEIERKAMEYERNIAQELQKSSRATEDIRELKKAIEKMRDERRDLENKALEIRFEVKTKEVEVQTLSKEVAPLKEKVTTLEGTVTKLRQMLSLAEAAEKAAKERADLLHAEAEKHKHDSGYLRDKEAEMNSVIDVLRSKLRSSVQLREEEKSDTQKLLHQTESALRMEQSKIENLESNLGAECSNLKTTLASVEQELGTRNAQNRQLQTTVQSQTSALSLVTSEKNVLSIKLNDLEQETRAQHEKIEELEKKTAELEQQAREDEALRRRLHNAVQELKGNIRVFCRVRPFLCGEELASDEQAAFEYTEKDQGLLARVPSGVRRGSNEASSQSWNFKFDHVFGPQSSQETVFTEISELVQSALDGYRVSIFAYGQTGSGKTHTMIGAQGDQLGMIPRSVHQVFDTAERLGREHWEFNFRASFVEIYNESCRDLLAPTGASNKERTLNIKFNAERRESEVVGVTVEQVESRDKILALLSRASRNRATAATAANDRSSRSHSVFRLFIDGENSLSGQKLNGLLNLVDLAGSERLNMSKARGERLRETQHINRSLSALGDVIAALANREKHIPYRNSKLTFLLQDSLGGDSKTLMFVNVSPVLNSFNESLCSLRFAAKVNACHIGTARKSSKIEL